MSFDQSHALQTGRAQTRDGRAVIDLRRVRDICGETFLTGKVAANKPPYRRGSIPLYGG